MCDVTLIVLLWKRFITNTREIMIRVDEIPNWRVICACIAGTVVAVRCYDRGSDVWKWLKARAFRTLIRLPMIDTIAAKQMDDAKQQIDRHCRSMLGAEPYRETLPRAESTAEQVWTDVERYLSKGSVQWKEGRVSGAVYADMSRDELQTLVTRVYGRTAYTNPLHPELFPGISRMEAEIVRCTCTLFGGDEDSCGSLTSGGTESILLAVKAWRDYARAVKGVTSPEMVVPTTAHAAFQKAAEMMRIKLRVIPVDPNTFKADVRRMRDACNSNTVLLVGSACTFPHGIVDPIGEIANIGVTHDIPVHVDSCLAGFLLPFCTESGFPMDETCDFRLKGVLSISADTHKYGFAPKGSSVLMFRREDFRRHQYSVQCDWPGGIYASPTIAGSRAGANIATCWATMMLHGRDGYVRTTRTILRVQRHLLEELRKIDGLEICGDPKLSVIAIRSRRFDIYRLSDELQSRGWSLNPLQFPAAIHFCITLMHEPCIDQLVRDVQEIAGQLLREKGRGDAPPPEGLASIYGTAQRLPDRTMVEVFATRFLDAIYKTRIE